MMENENKIVNDINRRIDLTKLMIEKRKERVDYYQKLIKMGLCFSDQKKLDIAISKKLYEIKRLSEELEWLYMQKAFYE